MASDDKNPIKPSLFADLPPELLPPTHPRGPRGLENNPLLRTADVAPLYPGEDRATTARWAEVYRSVHQPPNPPSQRGWRSVGYAEVYLGPAEPGMFEVPDGGLSEIARLRQQESATADLLRALDRAIAESRSLRDVDRTFENETRPL